jgi:DNA-binding transcriptional ArsR family regulator
MLDVLFIEQPTVAAALLQPVRLDIVKRLAQPRSCPELAQILDVPTQQINYHMRKLTEAGLVDRINERRVRGTVEGIYQARAASYWLSPNLVGRLGTRKTIDEAGLSYLLSIAEELQSDVAKLANTQEPEPSLGVSAYVELKDPKRRAEFLAEVQQVFQGLARKYGATGHKGNERERTSYRLLLACYQNPNQPNPSPNHE